MFTIGLTGGIGSGKSTVAAFFHELGAFVLDADKIGHAVLCLSEVKKVAEKRWGKHIFANADEIDRRRLASIVFAQNEEGRENLRYLTDITHPLIKARIESEIEHSRTGGEIVFILDAALLLESHWRKTVDKIVFVEARREIRLARCLTRGWSEAEFSARENLQLPIEQKRACADWIIENNGDIAETRRQVAAIWKTVSLR